MKTERELLIEAYIEQHPDAKLPAPEPVFFHGKLNEIIAYRLPIKLLVFNIRNGRFAAELIEEEKRLNRKLDPTKEDDVKVIQHLLLELNKGETDALKDDLKKNGQLYPGIITFDGAVINANRRMAILQVLNKETGDERFEYLKVARLPKGVDAKDLWRIEAKLQFGREFRLEYGQVNELLKIRAGKNSGLSDKQISEALAGRYTEKEVGERLEVLKLMDTYLHRIGKPGEYKHIQEEQAGEKFNSLQANVISSLKWSAHRLEIPKIVQIAFAMIEGKKHPHWKLRRLRDVAELPQARGALYAAFDKRGNLKTDRAVVLDAFDAADLLVEIERQSDSPEKLVNCALALLGEVDARDRRVKQPRMQMLVSKIQRRAVCLRQTIAPKIHPRGNGVENAS